MQVSQGDEQALQILSEKSPQNPEGHSSLQEFKEFKEFEDVRNLGESHVVQFLSDMEQVLQDGSQVLHCLTERSPYKELIYIIFKLFINFDIPQ